MALALMKKKIKLSAVPSLSLPVLNNLFETKNYKFINITFTYIHS